MPDEDLKWYSRFADVPGANYTTPERLKRVPATRAKPKVESHTYDGKTHKSLWWTKANGDGSSSSPASDHFDAYDQTADVVIRKMDEALELPGTATDYHFILAQAHPILFSQRRDHPGRQGWLYLEIERICRLDILLVTAQPHVAVDRYGPRPKPLKLNSVDRLATMYEREGALLLALEVLEFDVARGAPPAQKLESMRQRAAVVAAEVDGTIP